MNAESTKLNTSLNVSVYASIVNYTVYIIPLQSQTGKFNMIYKLLYRLVQWKHLPNIQCHLLMWRITQYLLLLPHFV